MIDQSLLSEQQIEQVRQIAREEMAASIEGVMNQLIDRRLAGVPTVHEMTLLFERQQQTIHEFISSTDLYLRRAEKKFSGIDDIQRDIGLLVTSVNSRNYQMDEMQINVSSIDGRVDRNSETLVSVQGKYDNLKTSIFGDPSSPEIPSLTSQLNDRSVRADEQHEEIKNLLTTEIKPGIESVQRRLIDVEIFIAKQRQWVQMGKDAVKFVAANPKWIAVIAGSGTGMALLIEWLKALTR